MNSNKLCFAYISDLIFLPLAQKGETFFHGEPQHFNFWSKPMVTLYIFLPLSISPSCCQLLICLLKFRRKMDKWKRNPRICMFLSIRLVGNTASSFFLNHVNCSDSLSYFCIPRGPVWRTLFADSLFPPLSWRSGRLWGKWDRKCMPANEKAALLKINKSMGEQEGKGVVWVRRFAGEFGAAAAAGKSEVARLRGRRAVVCGAGRLLSPRRQPVAWKLAKKDTKGGRNRNKEAGKTERGVARGWGRFVEAAGSHLGSVEHAAGDLERSPKVPNSGAASQGIWGGWKGP